MSLTKLKKDKKIKPKTEKKLAKLINESESGSESEHELSYYLNDRVKMMKEVICILKPKKIKCMAPTCMKDLNNEEISSMLLEELLGISNKRLKKIFSGQPQDDDTSSTEDEEEQPLDVISLDDVTDDDFIIDLDADEGESSKTHKKKGKVKQEPKEKKTKVKKEKPEKSKSKYKDGIMDEASEEHLMSVLELLELQARARAIRSQLALENSKKSQELGDKIKKNDANSDGDDAIIIESPKNEEIVITSSDSEKEESESYRSENKNTNKNQRNIGYNEDTNLFEKEKMKQTNTSKKITSTERINNDDMENISNSPSVESGTSKLDYIPDNPEEINKLLNKFHKMKRRKRKSTNDEKHKNENGIMEKKCYKIENFIDLNELKTNLDYESSSNDIESNKQFQNSTFASTSQEIEVKCTEDIQRTIFVDNGNTDGDDGIILTVDPAEMDSINLEPESGKESANNINIIVNELVKPAQMCNQKEVEFTSIERRRTLSNSCEMSDNNLMKVEKNRKENTEDAESIILNVDQSELDSINMD